MQQALYHPEHGYYSSGRCAIGRKGDYFTNVSVGSLFGQLLAAQLSEIWEQFCRPDHFVIVEEGAHDGQFACDVLESLQKRAPNFWDTFRFARAIEVLIRHSSKSGMRTSRCMWIGRALPSARRQMACG